MISAKTLYLLLSTLTMNTIGQSISPSISNGTCYYNGDEQAADTYIPCGNDAVVPGISCCQVGDICLSSNACFNPRYGVTYLAGCTDPAYRDSTCPKKGKFYTQQWVGLVRCFVSNDSSFREEVWTPCQDKAQPVVSYPDKCDCDLSVDTPAFTDSPVLTNIVQLPLTVGGRVSWFPGFEDPSTVDDSKLTQYPTSSSTVSMSKSNHIETTEGNRMTKSASSPAHTSSESSFNESSTLSSSASSNRLSTGAKIGIGVGVGIPTLAMIGIGGCYLWLRKRRVQNAPTIKDQIRPYSGEGSVWMNRNETTSPVVDKDSGYSGYKSELPAESTSRFSTLGAYAADPSDRNGGSFHQSPRGTNQPKVNDSKVYELPG